MINKIEYQKRRVANLEFETALERAKASVEFLEEQYQSYKNTCNHELLIKFGKKNPPYEQLGYGYTVCLCCGKEFNNRTIIREHLDYNNILNVIDVIPAKYYRTGQILSHEGLIRLAEEKTFALVARARNKMDEIMLRKTTLDMSDIEREIIEDLINYCQEEIKKEEEYRLTLMKFMKH